MMNLQMILNDIILGKDVVKELISANGRLGAIRVFQDIKNDINGDSIRDAHSTRHHQIAAVSDYLDTLEEW